MDSLARAVEAADGPWPVFAIAILGLYVLVWKFGGQLLTLAKASAVAAELARLNAEKAHETGEQVKADTQSITESIITNHGSKNIGDAVDRLTEQVGLLHLELVSVKQDTDMRLRILEQTRS